MERQLNFTAEQLKPLTFCDKNIGFEFSDLFIPPQKTIPTIGEKHDYNNCEGCKKAHASITASAALFFEKFPNCCDGHKRLSKVPGFERSLFADVSTLVADKVIFTKQHFLNNLENDEWYKEFTDYFTYNVMSLGSTPPNTGSVPYVHHYFNYTKEAIQKVRISKKYEDRRKKILEYISNYGTTGKKNTVSFNVLISIYENWFKYFPFELSFFQDLKPKYQKIPFGTGKPGYNKYLNMSYIIPFTKEELLEFLVNLTNTIITKVNTKKLFEEGLITEPDKINLELILQRRTLELKDGYLKSNIDEQAYRKMLKKWLKDEKRFIDEITPILKNNPSRNNPNQNNDANENNDFLESTIEDYLSPFRGKMNEQDYKYMVECYKQYFHTNTFPNPAKEIKFRGKINVKKLGWALNQLYRSEKEGSLPYEYIVFASNYISVYKECPFKKDGYKNTRLYKYFTTKA